MLIPKETALLPTYMNPLKQAILALAEDSCEVVFTIFLDYARFLRKRGIFKM